MKGEEKLWTILNDKLETLRASNRLPEAVRVAETALDLAKRAFLDDHASLALSFEKLGLLLDQSGDRVSAKPYLLKAHALLEKVQPPDQRAMYRSARRLAYLCDNLGQSEEAIRYYEKAIAAGTQLEDLPYSDLGTMLNNVALIFRKSGRQKAAEPYYLHALQIYEKQLGPEHADVASVLNNLAVFYTNERRYSEAEKTHLRALGIREKAHPSTHPDIAQSKCNLAVSFIRAAITPKPRSFIARHSRVGKKLLTIRRKITRSLLPITRIYCDRLGKRARRTNSKCARARNDA